MIRRGYYKEAEDTRSQNQNILILHLTCPGRSILDAQEHEYSGLFKYTPKVARPRHASSRD
jgi:hypothetical protein